MQCNVLHTNSGTQLAVMAAVILWVGLDLDSASRGLFSP